MCISLYQGAESRTNLSKQSMLTWAKVTHFSVKNVGYCQWVELMRIPKPQSHYRYYNKDDIETLNFIYKDK